MRLGGREKGSPEDQGHGSPDDAPGDPQVSQGRMIAEEPSGCPVGYGHGGGKTKNDLGVGVEEEGGAEEEGVEGMGSDGGREEGCGWWCFGEETMCDMVA